MPEVRLIRGTARSDRATAIDDLLIQHWGRARLIVPTRSHARQRAHGLISRHRLSGICGNPVATFEDFAHDLLARTEYEQTRLSTIGQRLLLQRAVEQISDEGKLRAYGSAVETEGFLNHLQRTIAQLKQAAIDPELFARRLADTGNVTDFDRSVAEVYTRYQELLHREQVYDLQGMYWVANELCLKQEPRALQTVDALLLDNFDDFTSSEFRLIETVAKYVDLLVFGVNIGSELLREDVHKLPADTVQRIAAAFTVDHEDNRPQPKPATSAEYAADHLFWRDVPRGADTCEANIELWRCEDPVREIEAIARSVKRLVVEDDVPLNTIAVVFPDLHAAAPTLRQVFHEFGIPASGPIAPTLNESSLARFLLKVLTAFDDWDRETVVSVLTDPWLHAGSARTDDYSWLAREAGIVAGRYEWISRLKDLSTRLVEPRGERIRRLLGQHDHVRDACAEMLDRLDQLSGWHDTLPRAASAAGYNAWVNDLVEDLDVAAAIDAIEDEDTKALESSAFDSLQRALGTLDQWTVHDNELSLQRYAALLAHAFEDMRLDPPKLEPAVWCCDLESIRHMTFDFVYLVSANEGSLPRRPKPNAIYGERDRARLAQAGIPLEAPDVHSRQELLLFVRLFEASTQRMVVSWHAAGADGRPKLPSPFVHDLRELLPQLQPIDQPSVPEPEAAASTRDLQNAVFARSSSCPKGLREDLHHIVAGIDAERQRYSDTFGVFDGILADTEQQARIIENFGDTCVFSASSLETYIDCPFRFFLERVLQLEEPPEPEAGLDPMTRGQILHDVLEAFHRQFRGQSLDEIPASESAAIMERLVNDRLKGRGDIVGPDAIVDVERLALVQTLLRYLDIERNRAATAQWKPSHFEVAFGREPETGSDTLSSAEPFTLDTPAGPIAFSGRIDRIDLNGAHARIIDYKSGGIAEDKDIKEGRSIQLGLYALAVETLVETACSEAVFVQVGRTKTREALKKDKSKEKSGWEMRREVLIDAVANAVRGIRGGRFHPTSKENPCIGCPAGRICRYEQARIERKEHADG